MRHASECAEKIIGTHFTHQLCGHYDWSGWWPVVDESLNIIDLYDGTGNQRDEYVIADVEHGKLVRIGDGSGCDVAIEIALARKLGYRSEEDIERERLGLDEIDKA